MNKELKQQCELMRQWLEKPFPVEYILKDKKDKWETVIEPQWNFGAHRYRRKVEKFVGYINVYKDKNGIDYYSHYYSDYESAKSNKNDGCLKTIRIEEVDTVWKEVE